VEATHDFGAVTNGNRRQPTSVVDRLDEVNATAQPAQAK
jgi:hypothetical protein